MGKSWKSNALNHSDDCCNAEKFSRNGRFKKVEQSRSRDNTVWVSLNDCYITEIVVQHLLARDFAQIEKMRAQFEDGKEMVRVVLRGRTTGGYNVEDGRHRVIAAKLAGMSFIEALIIGA